MFGVTESMGPGGEVFISGELFVNDSGFVPVPAALPLFAAGIGLLAGYRRQRSSS
jgi:hypothetical protein